MKLLKSSLALLVLCAMGCGTYVKVTRLTKASLPPTTECEVFTASTPDRPFIELALIEVNEGGSVIAQKKAMQMGADAIILKGSVVNGPRGVDSAYKIIFVAIKWK